jgi:WD40 repeat protein
MNALLYIPNTNKNQEQICIGGRNGVIKLYEIQQQQRQQQINFKLVQTFAKEHPSHYISCISCLLQINPDTLISASDSSSNVIVIWSKSKSSSLQYEPIQRITKNETVGEIGRLVLIKQKKEEEEFASCSYRDGSIIIWRRVKGEGEMFKIKQKIENVNDVDRLLYISLTNELISGSWSDYPSSLLQIWSPSSSSSSFSSKFVERQKIETYSGIYSLCQINRNDTNRRIEFASGHENGQIMIWSKQQQQLNESEYFLLKTLKPFNNERVTDLIFLNDNGFECLISCCYEENKIVIYKGEEEEKEELEHKRVLSLIPMSNGQFASGGYNQCLNIWSPSSYSY